MRTPCKLHVKAKIISVRVAYGSALPVMPAGTIFGMVIPPSYSTITVEKIVDGANNEQLELHFVGAEGEKILGEAVHSCILWASLHHM